MHPPLDSLPLIVCTNTWRDYAVTVRRGAIDARTVQRVLRELLPAFARVVVPAEGEFETAVGALEIEGLDDVYLAYRVFDVGEFRGRPHTIGVVAVVVPRRPRRDWSVAQLLARMLPPQPDSDDYALPDMTMFDEDQQAAAPFVQIERWEAAGELLFESRIACFCEPASIAPAVVWTATPKAAPRPAARRGRKRWIAGLIAAAMLLGGAALWRVLRAPPDDIPPPPAGKATEDRAVVRRRLAHALARNYFITEHAALTASNGEIEAAAELAVVVATQNMRGLRDAIAPMEAANDPADIAAVMRRHLERWETAAPIHSAAAAASAESVAQQLRALEAYGRVFDEARDVLNSPDRAGIARLRQNLDQALAGAAAGAK